jgi:hypothetical protein
MTKELQVENDEQPKARGATATHRRGPGHRLTLADVMATLSEGLAHLLQRMELPVHVAMLASNGSGHLARYTLNLDGSAHSEFLAEYDDQGQGWRFPVHGLLLDNIGATARIVVMEKKRGNWNGQAQD